MLTRLSFLVLILLAVTTVGRTQTNTIALKKAAIAKARNDSEKVRALLSLCDETESLHSDSLSAYATQAGNIAIALHDVASARLAAYYRAYSFYHRNIPDSVDAIIGEDSVKRKTAPSLEVSALFDLLKARSLTRKQRYKDALAIYYNVLSEAEQRKDTLNQVRAMAGLGNIFNRTREKDALPWFLKGIGLGNNYRHKTGYLYTNAAVIYTQREKYDSAQWYVQKGIQYAKEAENLGDLSSALGLYSGLLMDMNETAKDPAKYAEAETVLQEGLAISQRINEPNDVLTHMNSLGYFYKDIGKPQKGVEICLEAIQLIRNAHLRAKLPYMYTILAENYAALGKYKEQAAIMKTLADTKDSLYEENSAEAMSELTTKYEVQKKENTIILQQLDLVKKDRLLYSSILLFVLAAVIFFFVFTNYKKRQKLRASIAVATAEEGERKRIAADLHDNLGAYAASIASNVGRLSFSGDAANSAVLQEVRNNSNAIVADLSDTIWALKKEALPLTAVSDRLKVFIQRIQNSYPGISVDVEENISKDHSLSPSQGFHLFQTLQEAINNALKHSRGTQVMVKVTGTDTAWEIRVEDNGSGMQAVSENSGGGNGLFNMQNRASDAGWTIRWEPNQPKGTVVVISKTA